MKSLVGLILFFFSVGCFALPDCPKDQTKRYHNCYGTYTFADGSKYVGEFKDGNFHGQGTFTYANNIQTINLDGAFVLDGIEYRENFSTQFISAQNVTIAFGDLSDAFYASSITAETFSFNGGDGTNFSASITSLGIGGSDFSMVMPELGNGLTIEDLTFSGSGTIVGTNATDTINASAASISGYTFTLDIDFREDSYADSLIYTAGAGKDIIVLRNFDSGEDVINLEALTNWSEDLLTGMNDISNGTAAALIGDVLGLNVSGSEVVPLEGHSAIYTFNGETYYLGATDGDSTFEDGEVIIRFIGVNDVGSDITDIVLG